jgi:radical SAM superfamily enzyme YgiQ (UPF0313 family)
MTDPIDIILIESSSSSYFRVLSPRRNRSPHPPLGVLSITSFLKLHGYRVHVVDLTAENFSRDRFKSHLRSLCNAPLAVGISLYTECVDDGFEIASIARAAFPHTKIVAGGPHATCLAEEVLRSSEVDYIVRGEGESTIVELLEHFKHPEALPLEEVFSISHLDRDGNLLESEARPFISSLDALPFPAYESVPEPGARYGSKFYFITSRGCPGRCIFCAARPMSGRRYRFHSTEWILGLVYEYFNRYRFDMLGIADDSFTVNRLRAKRFCRYLSQIWKDDSIPFECKSRANHISDELCNELSNAGCFQIHIGVESLDESVLKIIKKEITKEQVFKAIYMIRKYGVIPYCSFMIGNPGDTLETIGRTVLFAKLLIDYGIARSGVAYATPFPGTKLFEAADALGLKRMSRSWRKYNYWDPIFETSDFTAGDLRKAMGWFEEGGLGDRRWLGLSDSIVEEVRSQVVSLASQVKQDLTREVADAR